MTGASQGEPDEQRTELLSQLLLHTLQFLLSQQLPTGELAAFQECGSSLVPVSCPLLSALALDALDCLDPTSDHFHERLFDLLPPSARLGTRLVVDTLRWRLRLALAAAQSSSGVWQRHGPNGGSAPDAATTAMALVVYLANTRRPRQDCAAVLARFAAAPEGDNAGRILKQRVLHRIVDEGPTPAEALFGQLAPDDLFAPWLLAQAHLEGSLTLSAAQLEQLGSLSAVANRATENRLDTAFLLTIRGVCSLPTAALVDALLRDPAPPSRWTRSPLRGYATSPAATLAVVLRSLSQQILYPRGMAPNPFEPDPC